jgi:hypothetical protein
MLAVEVPGSTYVMYGGYEALMFSADKVKIIATSITIDCVWSFAVD